MKSNCFQAGSIEAVSHESCVGHADAAAVPSARLTPHAAIDLHQDAWVRRPCHYAYMFGPRAPFQELVRRTVPIAKAAVHLQVYENKLTDECGLIVDHDGSVSDYFRRRGTRWVVTLETSTATPLDRSTQVNLLWVKAFVDFAAGEPTATPSPTG